MRLAGRWFGRGQTAMNAGHAGEAIEDFRTALVYARANGPDSSDRPDYDLYLGRALAAAGRIDEARAYLLNLAERTPGNASVNLDLARLAARQNDVANAMRYYTAAIYGVWETDPVIERRNTRIEFAQFLLQHGRGAEAQAELNAMAANLPPDPSLHTRAGTLLQQAGAYSQALKQFEITLRDSPHSQEALRGAGLTEFQLGDYAGAAHYLERAVRDGANDSNTKQTLETAQQAVSLDPYTASLSATDRGERASRAFKMALARLKDCSVAQGQPLEVASPTSNAQQLYAQAVKLGRVATEASLVRHPDDVPSVMALAYQMESEATDHCGQPTGADLALELIARRHAGATP